MLTLRPKAWYSWDFHVLEGDEEVAFLDRRLLRERAAFAVGGERYEVRRVSMARGRFVLEREGQVIAEAAKTSPFRRRFEIRAGPELWVLEAVSAVRREFQLLRGQRVLGGVRPVSAMRRTATVDLPGSLPLPLQVFVAALVLVLWKRRADAAAAGS